MFLAGLGVMALIALFFIVTIRTENAFGASVVSFILGILVWTMTCEIYWDYQAQPKRYACEMRGYDYRVRTFSDSVVCVPRYRGSDSLNITGIR